MTFQFLNNRIPPTGADAMFQLKQFLVGLGWSVIASSDGQFSFSNTSDLLVKSGSGVGGMANTFAYFAIKQFGSPRSLCFQRGPFNDGWRISYTATGFDVFPSNPIGVATIPTSSTGDNNFVFGDDSTGFNKYKTLFGQDNTYKLQAGADDNGGGVFFFCYTGEKALPTTAFILDPLAFGSFDSSDSDPYVIYTAGKTSLSVCDIGDLSTIDGNCPFGWLQKDLPGAGFVRMVALAFTHPDSSGIASIAVPGNVESNPYNLKDQFFPVIYVRPNLTPSAPPSGYKGVSSMIQWMGTTRGVIYPVGIASAGDSIVVNKIVLPWNNSALII